MAPVTSSVPRAETAHVTVADDNEEAVDADYDATGDKGGSSSPAVVVAGGSGIGRKADAGGDVNAAVGRKSGAKVIGSKAAGAQSLRQSLRGVQ
jgi:hypothetical protein